MPVIQPICELKINGTPVPVAGFELNFPPGAIGGSLTAQFANRSLTPATGDTIDFSVGLTGPDGPSSKQYISSGVIAGQRYEIREPKQGDDLSVDGLNPLANRWDLSPRNTIVLYDPARSEVNTTTDQSHGLYDEDGNAIETTYEAVTGLDLIQVLDRAYVTGCGFSQVITNIETFPIRQVSFPVAASYHEAASQFIAMLEPLFVADDDGILNIWDTSATLPTGLPVVQYTLSQYANASIQKPTQQVSNAALVTYRVDSGTDGTFPDNATDRIETIDQSSGTAGQVGWSQTVIQRHIKDFHDNPDNPSAVTRSVTWQVVVNTYGIDPVDLIAVQTSRETQTDNYSNDWRLKSGFTKITEARSDVPFEVPTALREVARTTNLLIWNQSAFNPFEQILVWEREEISGTVLVAGDPTDPRSHRVPLVEANTNRIVANDGFQTILEGQPIRTKSKFWHETGSGQADLYEQTIDHLTGKVETLPVTSQQISDRRVNTGRQRQVTVLLRNTDSEALYGLKKPIAVDAGELPPDRAIALGHRRLTRLGNPKHQVQFTLAAFDANLRRGSLRDVQLRDGSFASYIVTGFRIIGKVEKGALQITMQVTAENLQVV